VPVLMHDDANPALLASSGHRTREAAMAAFAMKFPVSPRGSDAGTTWPLQVTRLHFAKYAVRGKAVDVAKLAYRGRIDSRITD